ncbi:MAG: zinc-ribbon domain-containing protein [Deltaproteobacteria bacterium]|nr:zinc-ribbon domain-containing protein [Deltaproteobacteria bacterium]
MIIEITCPFCQFSKRVPSEKIPDAVKWVTCPQCRQRFAFNKKEAKGAAGIPVPPPAIPYHSEQEKDRKETRGSPSRTGAPWEKRSEIGLWQGILQTAKAVLFSPETLFKELTYEGGKREPLAFGLLTGSIGSMLGLFWQSLIPGGLLLLGHSFLSQFAIGIIVLIVLAMIPLMVTIGIFIYTGILHVLLLMVRGANNGFEATFRVVSYSQAAQVVGIIPFIGGWVGGIWQLIIQVIGLREMHETSYLRVILAFVIPLFVGILLAMAVIIPLVIFLFRQPFGQIWS